MCRLEDIYSLKVHQDTERTEFEIAQGDTAVARNKFSLQWFHSWNNADDNNVIYSTP